MKLALRRVIVFTSRLDTMAAFYRDAIGLKQVSDAPGWKELKAGIAAPPPSGRDPRSRK